MADSLHDRPDEKARRERDPAKAVEQMEKVIDSRGRGDEEAPPLREEYGGPRQATDGTPVEPDGAAPELPTEASAREGTPPAGHKGDRADDPDTATPRRRGRPL
jgi:hypothetical protein